MDIVTIIFRFSLLFVFCLVVEVFDNMTSGGASQEEEIVDRWKLVLRTNDSEATIGMNAILRERVGQGVEIVGLRPGCVRCYLLCRTPTALQTLYDKLEDGSLKTTMQSIFCVLIGDEETVQVEQTKGRLSASELQRRVEVFRKDLGM